MNLFLSSLISLLYVFILAYSITFFHEIGHYSVAKLLGFEAKIKWGIVRSVCISGKKGEQSSKEMFLFRFGGLFGLFGIITTWFLFKFLEVSASFEMCIVSFLYCLVYSVLEMKGAR